MPVRLRQANTLNELGSIDEDRADGVVLTPFTPIQFLTPFPLVNIFRSLRFQHMLFKGEEEA